eukprot:g29097.t1
MAIASSLCALVFVAMVLSEACASKPLASRSVAVMLSVAVGLRSGWSGWRWLAWLSWFALIGTLGQRHIAVLQSLQKSGKLGELPVQRIAVRSAWEMFYLVLGAMIWQVGQGLFKMLINGVMPQELQFYAPWLPFFELGEDVDVGRGERVAAYYAPKEALKSKVGPHHFVCSVRHLDPSHAEGQRDLQLQQNTVRDMWLKCKDTTAGGLVANVNCFFPRLSGSTHCKEINLSGWVSADAADAWKKQHGSLPGGQGPNSRGQMRTMGSMEAILTPHGEIRHQEISLTGVGHMGGHMGSCRSEKTASHAQRDISEEDVPDPKPRAPDQHVILFIKPRKRPVKISGDTSGPMPGTRTNLFLVHGQKPGSFA